MLNDNLFGNELFIWLLWVTFVNVFQMYVCVSFSLRFEGGVYDLIVFIPDHCLSFIFP